MKTAALCLALLGLAACGVEGSPVPPSAIKAEAAPVGPASRTLPALSAPAASTNG
jgi:hypothetical protein